MTSVYDFEVDTISGQNCDMEQYRGKVMLIVNTASKCGLTPQFSALEAVYQQYHEQGFEVLGFPCNQFGMQDPGSNEEIQEFCQTKYDVHFPMHAKINVNGKDTLPLYEHLKNEALGLFGIKDIKWNFTKFLVGRDGKVIRRYSPHISPKNISRAIEQALAEQG